MIITFQDWQPDAADFGTQGSTTITNAVPSLNSFQSFPSLNVITTAISGTPLGGLEAFDKDEVSHMYVGDSTTLYELDEPNLTWTDVTRSSGGAYATASGEIWNFVRWKNKVIATNFSDNPQQITMGGSNFSELTADFRARNVSVVDDFVVFSNTFDSTDGNVPNRIRWSAIDDETDYTVSPTTLSNFRDLPTGGPIRRIIGGEVGVVVCERAIYRMDFVGPPSVFQTNEVQGDVGTICAGSVTHLGDSVFLISDQGFLEVTGNGTGKNSIGAGRVDQWFFDEYDPDYPERVFSMPDPTNNRILWCFPGADAIDGRPNKIIIYDKTFNKWALVEEDVQMILKSKGVAVTLDELDSLGFSDLDAMTVSLDSNQFKVLSSQIAAFNPNNKLGFFRGIAKTATLETGEIQFYSGSIAHLKSFAPLVDGGTVTAQIGSRRRMSNSVTWSSSISQVDEGKFTSRNSAKFHRFRISISGEWNDAVGVLIDPNEDVVRGGKRG